mgnify:CR=1 FL=1
MISVQAREDGSETPLGFTKACMAGRKKIFLLPTLLELLQELPKEVIVLRN